MKNNLKNQNGGFIGIIIMIVIVLLIMQYYGLTLTGIWNWFWSLVQSVF